MDPPAGLLLVVYDFVVRLDHVLGLSSGLAGLGTAGLGLGAGLALRTLVK